MKKINDIIGSRFGRLVVIECGGQYVKNRHVIWKCQCDCGKISFVDTSSLRCNKTTSCGCYRNDIRKRPIGEASAHKLFICYKNHAKRRKLNFDILEREFLLLTTMNCYYCDRLPSNIIKSQNNNGDYIYSGVDRIDSSKGYTKENCVPCCGMCNKAKMNYTREQFFDMVERIYNHSIRPKL